MFHVYGQSRSLIVRSEAKWQFLLWLDTSIGKIIRQKTRGDAAQFFPIESHSLIFIKHRFSSTWKAFSNKFLEIWIILPSRASARPQNLCRDENNLHNCRRARNFTYIDALITHSQVEELLNEMRFRFGFSGLPFIM